MNFSGSTEGFRYASSKTISDSRPIGFQGIADREEGTKR